MALTQRLQIRQSQGLVMTPQLMQAIKLLQLSNLDLAAYVEAELERNPLLERGPDGEPGSANAGEPTADGDVPDSASPAAEFADAASGDEAGEDPRQDPALDDNAPLRPRAPDAPPRSAAWGATPAHSRADKGHKTQ